MLSTILEARDLSKSFAGPPLFTALSFRLENGLLAVTGRNGSGKTTLIKILASLLRPGAGTVRIERAGEELSGDERRLAVGSAGPDLAFYDDLSAVENLAFFRKAAGWRADTAELERRLPDTGLELSAARRRVGGYSTGMRQRLRIAFALLFDPPVLLLDEPALGLDAEGRAAVEGVIARRRREAVVVVASNDPRDLAQPDQVIELGRNR